MDRFVRFLPVYVLLFSLAACSALSPDVEKTYPKDRPDGGYHSSSRQSFPSETKAVPSEAAQEGSDICVGAWCNCDAY